MTQQSIRHGSSPPQLPQHLPNQRHRVTEVCVVVPTRHEADNIERIVERTSVALTGIHAELLFVDDSDDHTPQTILAISKSSSMPVRLCHRPPVERRGGLGGAVVAGLKATDARWIIVMDGDLQHPPEVIPELIDRARSGGLDLVVASRYAPCGEAGGLASPIRHVLSSGAATAARLLFPTRLASLTDPMSGFFAVRADAVTPSLLRPRGFKILLEILVRSKRLRVGEVPFAFGPRQLGQSKASWTEGLRYLLQLAALRLSALSTSRVLRFGGVGASGLLVNLVALTVLLRIPLPWSPGLNRSVCAALATQAAIIWNFMLSERWIFAERYRPGGAIGRLVLFSAIGYSLLLAQLPLAALVKAATPLSYVQATAACLVSLFLLRYALLNVLLYPRARSDAPSRRRPWSRGLLNQRVARIKV